MRLLLDELFPPEIARALRQQGHDVRAIQEEPAQRGLSDGDPITPVDFVRTAFQLILKPRSLVLATKIVVMRERGDRADRD